MANGNYPVVTRTESFADMFNVLGSLFLRYKDTANARAVEAERLGLERARVAIQRDQANWQRMNSLRQHQLEREKLALSGRQIDIAGGQALGEGVDRAEAAATRSEKLVEANTAKFREKSIAFATSQGEADSKAYVQSKEGAPQLVEALAEKFWRFTKHDGEPTLGHRIWNSSVSDNRRLYGSQWGLMQALEGSMLKYVTQLDQGKAVKIVYDKNKPPIVIPGRPGGPNELDMDQLIRGVGAQMAHTSATKNKILDQKYGTSAIRHYLSPLADTHRVLISSVETNLERNAEYSATLGVYSDVMKGDFGFDDKKRLLSAYDKELVAARRQWGVAEPLESLIYQQSVGKEKQRRVTGTDDYGRPIVGGAGDERTGAAEPVVQEGPGYGEPIERGEAKIWSPFSGFQEQDLGGFGVDPKTREAWGKAYGAAYRMVDPTQFNLMASTEEYKSFGRFWRDLWKFTIGADTEAFDKTLRKFGAGVEDQKAIAGSLISDFGKDGSLLNAVFGTDQLMKKGAAAKETKLREAMRKDLFNDESLRLYQYDDATGNPILPGQGRVGKVTIGYGRCLETNPLSRAEERDFKSRYPDIRWNEYGPTEIPESFAKELRETDISTVIGGGERNFSNFWDLATGRQLGLGNMMYNMGIKGATSLDGLVPAVESGNFGEAAGIVDNQGWWGDIVGPGRKERQVKRLLHGEE